MRSAGRWQYRMWAAAALLVVAFAAIALLLSRHAAMSAVQKWWWAVHERGAPVADDNGRHYWLGLQGGAFRPAPENVGDALVSVKSFARSALGATLVADVTADREGGAPLLYRNCRGSMSIWRPREIVWRTAKGEPLQTWRAVERR